MLIVKFKISLYKIKKEIHIFLKTFSHIKEMKAESIDDILTMLLRGLVMLENDLKKKVLVEKISNDIRIKYLNTLKIVMYLTFKLTNHFEKKLQSSKDHDLLNGSTLKGKFNLNKKRYFCFIEC